MSEDGGGETSIINVFITILNDNELNYLIFYAIEIPH
jgi:hypothetical protein